MSLATDEAVRSIGAGAAGDMMRTALRAAWTVIEALALAAWILIAVMIALAH